MKFFLNRRSFKLSSGCLSVPNELAADANGDGVYGDDKGFIYPGAPNVIKCDTYIPPSAATEVCKSVIGCPSTSSLKYQENNVYSAYLYDRCSRQKTGQYIFVISGVLLIFSSITWLLWTKYEKNDVRKSVQSCGIIGQILTMLAFVFTVFAVSSFYSSGPATNILGDYMDCSAASTKDYYIGSLVPVDRCLVLDKNCDPYDFGKESGYFGPSSKLGTCEYVNPEIFTVRCETASDGLGDLKSVAVGDCEDVDCRYVSKPYGSSYTSKCCIARRRCCGDDAECETSDICQWNSTYVKNGNSQSNVCFNRFTDEATECNENQRKAFEAKLRNGGKCFSPVKPPILEDEIDGSNPSGTSELCRPNRKQQLIEAAVYYATNSQDENLKTLTRKIVEDNTHECMVRQIFTSCYTDCMGKPALSCANTLPFPGAPNNCTLTGTVCVPNKNSYTDPAVQQARPIEYCESLYDGTSDTTIAASKTACLATNECYWANVFGSERCLSKSCPGVPGNVAHGAYGYQPSQNPPCFAGDYQSNDHVSSEFKVCQFPEKGCTLTQQTALCETETALSGSYYYTPSNLGKFNPGPAFNIAECKVAPISNCTQIDTLSGINCVLVKGSDGNPACTSQYAPCTDGSNVKNQYYRDLGIIKESQASSDRPNSCYNDKSGQIFAPLVYDLYLCRVFFTIGTVFAFITLPIFILIQPIFLYIGK